MSFLNLSTDSPHIWEQWFAQSSSLTTLSHSLQRCWERASSHNVNPRGPLEEPIQSSALLREGQESLAPITRQLNEQWSPLLQSLSEQNFKLLLSDANGMVVEEWGGGEFAEQAKKVRLIRGSLWGEGIRGTNAIGTAIAERRPVAVHGSAHYQRQNHELVCYAAPFHDTKGRLLGVLDATSFAKAAHPSVMMSVMTVTKAIEEWLRLRESAKELVLPTVVERLLQSHPGPAMLVEPSGQIRLVNAQALASFAPLNTTALPLSGSLYKVRQSIQSLLGVSEQVLFDPQSHKKAVRLGPSLQLCLEVESVFSHAESPRLLLFEQCDESRGRVSSSFVRIPTPTSDDFAKILGDDPQLLQTLDKARRLARSRLPLLLLSPTGTGKEMLAKAIHSASPRSEKPFVALNCAALSPSLLASELFGYAPNAFTGASPRGRQGHIAGADGGTLFLDEIAETPPSFQAMLLRLLEDGSYYPVGDTTLHKVNVRLVCATCKDLRQEVEEGRFREDLFYRIRGTILTMPSVVERADFVLLVEGLLQTIASELELEELPHLTHEALALLQRHDWPGNVRELRHVLHCAVILAMPHPVLLPRHISDSLPQTLQLSSRVLLEEGDDTLESSKLSALQKALEETQGNVSAAARMLGVARSTIYRMLKRQQTD